MRGMSVRARCRSKVGERESFLGASEAVGAKQAAFRAPLRHVRDPSANERPLARDVVITHVPQPWTRSSDRSPPIQRMGPEPCRAGSSVGGGSRIPRWLVSLKVRTVHRAPRTTR